MAEMLHIQWLLKKGNKKALPEKVFFSLLWRLYFLIEEDLVKAYKCFKGRSSGIGARFFSGAQWQDKEQWAQTET